MPLTDGHREDEAKDEEVVERAVRFLGHPKAAHAPIESQRAFLRSKGLTVRQIDTACARIADSAASSSTPAVTVVSAGASGDAAAVEATRAQRTRWKLGAASVGALGAAALVAAWRHRLPGGGHGEERSGGRCGRGAEGDEPSEGNSATPDPARAVEMAAETPETDPRRAKESLSTLRALLKDAESAEATAVAAEEEAQRCVADAQAERLRRALDAICAAAGWDASTTDGTTPPPPELAHAVHSLSVVLNSQLRHPGEARYQRVHASNASMSRLLAMKGAPAVLRAIGFEPPAAGAANNWVWTPPAGMGDGTAWLSRARDMLLDTLPRKG